MHQPCSKIERIKLCKFPISKVAPPEFTSTDATGAVRVWRTFGFNRFCTSAYHRSDAVAVFPFWAGTSPVGCHRITHPFSPSSLSHFCAVSGQLYSRRRARRVIVAWERSAVFLIVSLFSHSNKADRAYSLVTKTQLSSHLVHWFGGYHRRWHRPGWPPAARCCEIPSC